MYKIVIIAEPQKKAVINLIDLDKKVTIGRVATLQPQLIDYLKSFANIQEVNQISVCGPRIYISKIINDITEEFPQVNVEEIN